MTLNPADDNFIARLRGIVPDTVFRPIEPRFLEEPRGRLAGQGGLLACPRTADEVSALITAANDARVGVVPYGGGTGLVGAQIMTSGPAPLILALERMNDIRAIYPDENVLVAEAGAVLADVQVAAREVGRLFPLTLASEGSARIGGNLASNAGGMNVLRYGNTRDLCLGLEAVLPDGRIWNGLTRLRKDNTGYDLRNLLIGAEGTLGVITAAALKLSPIPAATGTALFVVPSPQAAIELLSLARTRLGEGISAFELLHEQGFKFLSEVLPEIRQPFETPPEWCVLIELGLIATLDPEDQLAQLFEAALDQGLALDGLIAKSEAQRDAFWTLREHLPEANRRIGSISSHDVSIPLNALPDFIRKGREVVAGIGDFRINCFGHVGDGNLHYNVFAPKGIDRATYNHQSAIIRRAIHDLVAELDGSFSAEHGIGRVKVADLEAYGDPVKLAAMRAIKTALDPNGIMNPGAVLRV